MVCWCLLGCLDLIEFGVGDYCCDVLLFVFVVLVLTVVWGGGCCCDLLLGCSVLRLVVP